MFQNVKKSEHPLVVKDYAEGLFQEAVNRATARLVSTQIRMTADLVEAREVINDQHKRLSFLEEEITGLRDLVSGLVLKEKKHV